MNIFSEIYGAYYRIAAKVLEEKSVTPQRLDQLIRQHGFRDSVLFVPQKLSPRSEENWGLLKEDNGKFNAVTHNKPPKIVTTLQKRWLKAILSDQRVRLFMSDETISRLENRLADVPPLYRPEHFLIADRFTDGDDYGSEDYRNIFRTILNATRSKKLLDITFRSSRGALKKNTLLPVKIEYSHKNDKFRLYAMRVKSGNFTEGCIVNIGRVIDAAESEAVCLEDTSISADMNFRRCKEPIEVHVLKERNAMERFLMEFASYEKQTELDDDGKGCIVRIWYDKSDETEMLIRLLSYGAVLEIVAPPKIRSMAAARVRRQYDLFFCKDTH